MSTNKDSSAERAAEEGHRVYRAVPQLGRLREHVLVGDVWKQPELSVRDRSLVTCSVLAALGKFDEMQVHMARAVANGVTRDELRGLIVQIAFYAGWPAAIMAGRAALALLEHEVDVRGVASTTSASNRRSCLRNFRPSTSSGRCCWCTRAA